MAFEDRCSPQSAPSPPGIPHSPHNGQHHQQQLHHQQYTTTTTATSSASTGSPQISPDASTPTMHSIKQEPLSGAEQSPAAGHEQPAVRFSISNILSDSFGKVPAAPTTPVSTTTTTPKTLKITSNTAEKKNTLLFRPYDHISRQSSASPELPAPQAPSASSSPIAASLHAHHQHQLHAQAQLLHHQQHQHYLQQQHQQQQHHQHAFMQQLEEMRIAQFRLAQQQHEAAVLDFSRAAAAAAAAAAAIRVPGAHPHHPMVLQPQPQSAMPSSQQPQQSAPLLFNTFNMQAYPKIHEEIRHQQQQQQHNHLQHHQLASAGSSINRSPPPPPPQQQPITSMPMLSDSSFAKIPPLGNLCKTVSQIGQPSPRPLPCRSPTSSVSSSSASSTASSLTPVKSATAAKSGKKPTTSGEPKATSASATTGSGQPLRDSGMESSDDAKSENGSTKDDGTQLWPAWVYCTRYSDRPSSGPRYRKPKVPKDKAQISDEKRPRTAFSSDQLARLKREFIENRYLTERRRQQLSAELGLNEAQIKIWFQNKRAKIKKTSGNKNPLALQLMAQGLYNHSTVPLTKEEEELEMRMNGQIP